jgi:hypothetical protein
VSRMNIHPRPGHRIQRGLTKSFDDGCCCSLCACCPCANAGAMMHSTEANNQALLRCNCARESGWNLGQGRELPPRLRAAIEQNQMPPTLQHGTGRVVRALIEIGMLPRGGRWRRRSWLEGMGVWGVVSEGRGCGWVWWWWWWWWWWCGQGKGRSPEPVQQQARLGHRQALKLLTPPRFCTPSLVCI